jgi:hypothetical protein
MSNKYTPYIILFILLAVAVWYFYIRKSKYYLFFQKELGFGDILLDKFTRQELEDSYYYIKSYTRNGVTLTPDLDPAFYARIKAINDKFHIFSSI